MTVLIDSNIFVYYVNGQLPPGAKGRFEQAVLEKIKLPDAIIAASALTHGLRLMTRNVDDFKATGVELINPWDTQ